MSFSEMIKILHAYQENSDIQFDLSINSKNKTIKIEFNKSNEDNI